LLRLDKAKLASEANMDGKYLLRCSDPHLAAEDVALGYKQLLQVERGRWRPRWWRAAGAAPPLRR
jgi:hypothetical protein